METTSREFQIPASKRMDDILEGFEQEGLYIARGFNESTLYVGDGEYNYRLGSVNDKRVLLTNEDVPSSMMGLYALLIDHMNLMETGRKYDVSGMKKEEVLELLEKSGFKPRQGAGGWNIYVEDSTIDRHFRYGRVEGEEYVGKFDGRQVSLHKPQNVSPMIASVFNKSYRNLSSTLERL